MSFFGKVLNTIKSVPAFGTDSSILRKGAALLDRVEKSSVAAGELGAMGPVALLVEPKTLKTVATGEGPTPVVISPNLGGKGALAAGELGAMGPVALLAKPSLLKTVVSGDSSTTEQPKIGGAILRHAANGEDTLRGSAVAAGIFGAMGPAAFAVDPKMPKAIIGLDAEYNYGKPIS